jgi:UDP-glucose:(heptosyl)LPS alpha-1,3-glucosyltransferase
MERYAPSRGGERYFAWLARELAERGHDVHVFATVTDAGSADSYQVHKIPGVRFPRSLRILCFLIGSARAVRSYRFDIVHGVGETLTANVLNPHGGIEQAYLSQEFASISNKLYRGYKRFRRYLSPHHYLTLWIQKKQYADDKVQRIIAISQMIKKDIRRFHHVPEEKIRVVFNSVDLKRFRPENRARFREALRQELAIDNDTIVLLFAGNNYRLKGLDRLLESLMILHQRFPTAPFRLVVVGRGDVNRYGRLADTMGLSHLTTFLGSVKGMDRYYAASDIYVHPTFYDSCSLTVLEALASGLPVVTTRFNGAAEAIQSKDGGIVIDDPRDIEGLAGAIGYYFDEGRRRTAVTKARECVEVFPPVRTVEETLEVYYDVVRH